MRFRNWKISALMVVTAQFAFQSVTSTATKAPDALIQYPLHEFCEKDMCHSLLMNGGPRTCNSSERVIPRDCEPDKLTAENYEVKPLDPEIKDYILRLLPAIRTAAKPFDLDPALIVGLLATSWTINPYEFFSIKNFSVLDPASGLIRETSPNGGVAIPKSGQKYMERAILRLEAQNIDTILNIHAERNWLNSAPMLNQLHYFAALVSEIKEDADRDAPKWAQGIGGIASILFYGPYEVFINRFPKSEEASRPLTPAGWYAEYIWPEVLTIMEQKAVPLAINTASKSHSVFHPIINFFPSSKQMLNTTSTIPLYARPDNCSYAEGKANQRSDDRAQLERLTSESKLPLGVSVSGTFSILEQTFSCNESWSLVEFNERDLGWAKNSNLKGYTDYLKSVECTRDEALDYCRSEVELALGSSSEILEYDADRGIMAISLVGFSNVDSAIDYERFSNHCMDSLSRTEQETRRQIIDANRAEKQGVNAIKRAEFRKPISPYNLEAALLLYRDIQKWTPLTTELRKEIDENVLRIKLEFELAFGYDIFAPKEELEPLLRWYEQLDYYCAGPCQVPEASEFSTFFNLMQVKNFAQPGFLQKMVKDYGVFERKDSFSRPSGRLPSVPDLSEEYIRLIELDEKPWAEQKDLVANICAVAIEQIPIFANTFFEFESQVNDEISSSPFGEEIRPRAHLLAKLISTCNFFNQYLDRKNGIHLDQPYHNHYYDGYFQYGFDIELIDDNAYKPYYTLGADALAINFDNDFIQDLLLKVLNSLKREFTNTLYYSQRILQNTDQSPNASRYQKSNFSACAYNPIASADRIEQLRDLSCVTGVMIPPEQYLEKVFTDPRKRGVIVYSKMRDRFFVKLNESCAQ